MLMQDARRTRKRAHAARPSCRTSSRRVGAKRGRGDLRRRPGCARRPARAASRRDEAEQLCTAIAEHQDHGAAHRLPRRRSARSCCGRACSKAVQADFYTAVTPPARRLPRQSLPDRGRRWPTAAELPADELADAASASPTACRSCTSRAPARSPRRRRRRAGRTTACQQPQGRPARRPAGRRRAHRQRLGAVHQREQGGHGAPTRRSCGRSRWRCRSAAAGWASYIRRGKRLAEARARSPTTSRSTSRTSAIALREILGLSEAQASSERASSTPRARPLERSDAARREAGWPAMDQRSSRRSRSEAAARCRAASLAGGKPTLQLPRAQPGQRALRPPGTGYFEMKGRTQGAHAHRQHGQDLRPDAQDDGPVQGAGRDRRHRHQARGLLRLQELGRGALRRAARESDTVMDDIEALFGVNREQLGFIPEEKGGEVAGQPGRHRPRSATPARRCAIDCTKFGTGAYSIPIAVEHLELRDQGQVHPGHRDRRHVPAAGQAQLLEEGQLHPGLAWAACRRAPAAASSAAWPTRRRLPVYVFVDGDPYGITQHLPHAQGRLRQRRAPQRVLLRAAGALPGRHARRTSSTTSCPRTR